MNICNHISEYVTYYLYKTYNFVTYFFDYKNIDPLESFYTSCKTGDIRQVKKLYKKYDLPLNKGLEISCGNGNCTLSSWLISHGANDLNTALESACKNNRYNTAELLMKKGANFRVGIRNTESANISRMLFRYEQNTDNIS